MNIEQKSRPLCGASSLRFDVERGASVSELGNLATWQLGEALIGMARGVRWLATAWSSQLAGECRLKEWGHLAQRQLGFRVASSELAAVPEPTTLLSTLALVSSGLLLRRRGKVSL